MLREGFVVGATNPKSMVFFVAVLPQFVDYPAGTIPLQLAPLGAVFLVIALVSDSIWALAAGTARHWFARSPKRVSTLERHRRGDDDRPRRNAGADGQQVLTTQRSLTSSDNHDVFT